MAKKTISKKLIAKIKNFVDLVNNHGIQVKQAYLFGSYASGKNHSGSDIDICIVSDDFKSWTQSIDILNTIRTEKGEFIDIEGHGFNTKDFNNKYLSLPVEIKQTGIRII